MSDAPQSGLQFLNHVATPQRMTAKSVAPHMKKAGTRLAPNAHMRCLALTAAAVLLVTMAPTDAAAQHKSLASFTSGIDLVTLDVTVTGPNGRLVCGLTPSDFAIFDDRLPQHLAVFAGDDQTPVAAVVLIDRSSSMYGPKLHGAQEAAAGFIRSLRPGDLVEVMAFNQRVDRLFPLGPDLTAAEGVLSDITADGQTALFEAVLIAARDLQAARRQNPSEHREAILVVSDGEDTISRLPFEDVLDEVRRSGVIVYGVSLRTGAREKTLPPLHEMTQLAYDTGGRAMAVRDLAGLVRVYDDIGAELRQMYRLAYSPAAVPRDGRWHSIVVRVLSENARARARAGYYAPRPSRQGELP